MATIDLELEDEEDLAVAWKRPAQIPAAAPTKLDQPSWYRKAIEATLTGVEIFLASLLFFPLLLVTFDQEKSVRPKSRLVVGPADTDLNSGADRRGDSSGSASSH